MAIGVGSIRPKRRQSLQKLIDEKRSVSCPTSKAVLLAFAYRPVVLNAAVCDSVPLVLDPALDGGDPLLYLHLYHSVALPV